MPDDSAPFTVPLTAYLGAVISHDMDRPSTLLDRVAIHVDDTSVRPAAMTNVIKVECLGRAYDVTVTLADET